MNNKILSEITPYADELKFVEEDIKKEFLGKSYMVGTPTQIQLIRTINKLIEALESLRRQGYEYV